jgi:hypothetical protein
VHRKPAQFIIHVAEPLAQRAPLIGFELLLPGRPAQPRRVWSTGFDGASIDANPRTRGLFRRAELGFRLDSRNSTGRDR